MSNKSLLEAAYEVIRAYSEEGGITFENLWVKANEVLGEDPENKEGRIGNFYTQLLTDGKFVNLGDNTWDLREKYTFDKVHIDMSDCYTEDEEDEEEADPEEDNEKDDEESESKDDDEDDSPYEKEEQEEM